jgi:predicted SAM-dependent methyltransferase
MSASEKMLIFEKCLHFRPLKIQDENIRLHFGSGQTRLEGYINIDSVVSHATDLVMDIMDLDLPANTVDEIYSSHMVEHLSSSEFNIALNNWLKVLKPGGLLTLRCPNFMYAVSCFSNTPEPECWKYVNMIFGPTSQGPSPYNLHKNGFSARRLRSILEDHGFIVLKCEEVSNRSNSVMNQDLFCVAQKPGEPKDPMREAPNNTSPTERADTTVKE